MHLLSSKKDNKIYFKKKSIYFYAWILIPLEASEFKWFSSFQPALLLDELEIFKEAFLPCEFYPGSQNNCLKSVFEQIMSKITYVYTFLMLKSFHLAGFKSF